MKITSVKGTCDYLPEEARLRDRLQRRILEVYEGSGFSRIITPILEDGENLDRSEGGENLSLMFRVLKRGEKLERALIAGEPGGLSDLGLRYDLTLPLSRYWANNRARLPVPLKCLQIGRVYRAERPQRGRLRELWQCDIDIVGTDSPDAETELIVTTAKALEAVEIRDFTVRISDRRLLLAVLEALGYPGERRAAVCMVIDKLRKIGPEGVSRELLGLGCGEESVVRLLDLLARRSMTPDTLRELADASESMASLERILRDSRRLAEGRYAIELDLSLVRGQGYYTGTVFEIESPDFEGSIAGGGRYDGLIGKFTGERVPAVGFSIGFERIYAMLKERGGLPGDQKRVAVLYGEGEFPEANLLAERLREEGPVTVLPRAARLGKQLDRLRQEGYLGYRLLGEPGGVVLLRPSGSGE